MRSHLLALTLLAVPTAASAVEYLTEVTSDVYPAPGMSTAQIVDRALQCIKSTSGNRAPAVEAAIDGDTVYAVVETDYRFAFAAHIVSSRLSVYARDQRFKIVHTDIDNGTVNPFTRAKMGVHTQPGGPAKGITAALAERSAAVSECIIKKPEVAGGDW